MSFYPVSRHPAAGFLSHEPPSSHVRGVLPLGRLAPLVPVYRQLTGDGLTPVSAFGRIERSAPSFLFESVIGGEKVGRFSFLGTEPFLRFEARGQEVTVSVPGDPRRDPPLRVGRPAGRPPATGRTLSRGPPRRGCPGSRAGPSAMRPTTRSATPSTCPTSRPTTGACPTCRSRSTTGWSSSTISARRSWSWPRPISSRAPTPRRPTRQACAAGRRAGRAAVRAGPDLALTDIDTDGPAQLCAPVELHPGGVRGGRPPLPGIHQGRRHLPGRAQPAVPGRDHGQAVRHLPRAARRQSRARSCST